MLLLFFSFSCVNVSQGCVATQLNCDGIFNNHIIANFPQNVAYQ